MKLWLLTVCLALAFWASGQQLYFQGKPVDTITICGSGGYFHFDEKRTTTGRTDYYTIAFDVARQQYRVSEFETVYLKNTRKPEYNHEKEKKRKEHTGKMVENSLINNLLNAFSSGNITPKLDHLGYDKALFQSLTDEKHIRRVAKKHKTGWYFKSDYTDKEEREHLFKSCQNPDTFNLFLATVFDTIGYPIVTDVWSTMDVSFHLSGVNVRFEGAYPNLVMQPWYNFRDTSGLPDPVLNLHINKALTELLPDGFYRKDQISFKALINSYIEWYLHRREVLFGFWQP